MKPILQLASRSYSNEAKGKDMYASISINGVVIAYIPDTVSGRQYADKWAIVLKGKLNIVAK